jgi:hypothetical protein
MDVKAMEKSARGLALEYFLSVLTEVQKLLLI